MIMSDRFDLEQNILRCWNIIDDIRLFARIGSTPEQMTALADCYEVYFQNLFDQMETMIKEGKIK
jgi:hypothetical protein